MKAREIVLVATVTVRTTARLPLAVDRDDVTAACVAMLRAMPPLVRRGVATTMENGRVDILGEPKRRRKR